MQLRGKEWLEICIENSYAKPVLLQVFWNLNSFWIICSHAMICMENIHSFSGRITIMFIISSFLLMRVTTKGHNPFSLLGEKFCCSLLCGLLDSLSWIPYFPPCHCIQGTLLKGFQQKVILRKECLIFVINSVGVPFCTAEQEDRLHCPFQPILPLFFCSST